jgi:hypothetical protein
MAKLTAEQKRIIDEIKREFIAINEKEKNNGELVDLDFLFKEKREWAEKVARLNAQNEHLLSVAKEECQIAFDKLSEQLIGIAKVNVRFDNYGGSITIMSLGIHRREFKIYYNLPHNQHFVKNEIGDYMYYADTIQVSGYVSGNHEVKCTSTEEFFKNEYVKSKIFNTIK